MNADTGFETETKTDLYYAVHKGIRLANARMLIALGQADAADEPALLETLGRLSAHLDLSLAHLTHENQKIHAAVEARLPGGSDHAGEDHDHHLEAFADLRRMAEEVAQAGSDRAARLRRLYQRFALFVADDLTHMHEEETELMPLIAANFSGAEIKGIEHSIVSAIAPEKMAAFLKVMLGAASPSERVGMVSGMRQAMPQEAFDGLFAAVVGPDWRMGDWAAMERALC
ncbi:hemerythrin domain-containing protein [Defluviimonas sp. WL0024]|uniref:Hemerythrin domain-containing protein n=2 Tax=Albidovulum TaxID=205889 RepID=A0ABT3J550_9RHOB|nr:MULTISPECIES: hemerythrin domain-containing protein [Defluviimonas]MCU9849066.1 hemerythrin domain-containing protein [Defluviimonas sp. WL0024]MCW3782807.1 hemerythrin domain-containing protein [Defluviimonas salinarum]